jgi:hypothetical protein
MTDIVIALCFTSNQFHIIFAAETDLHFSLTLFGYIVASYLCMKRGTSGATALGIMTQGSTTLSLIEEFEVLSILFFQF